MINLREHQLHCPCCQQAIPTKTGDFLKHEVRSGMGEKSYIICPQDVEHKKMNWIFEKDLKKVLTQ